MISDKNNLNPLKVDLSQNIADALEISFAESPTEGLAIATTLANTMQAATDSVRGYLTKGVEATTILKTIHQQLPQTQHEAIVMENGMVGAATLSIDPQKGLGLKVEGGPVNSNGSTHVFYFEELMKGATQQGPGIEAQQDYRKAMQSHQHLQDSFIHRLVTHWMTKVLGHTEVQEPTTTATPQPSTRTEGIELSTNPLTADEYGTIFGKDLLPLFKKIEAEFGIMLKVGKVDSVLKSMDRDLRPRNLNDKFDSKSRYTFEIYNDRDASTPLAITTPMAFSKPGANHLKFDSPQGIYARLRALVKTQIDRLPPTDSGARNQAADLTGSALNIEALSSQPISSTPSGEHRYTPGIAQAEALLPALMAVENAIATDANRYQLKLHEQKEGKRSEPASCTNDEGKKRGLERNIFTNQTWTLQICDAMTAEVVMTTLEVPLYEMSEGKFQFNSPQGIATKIKAACEEALEMKAFLDS